jgi:GT2 family glycosyltransferase
VTAGELVLTAAALLALAAWLSAAALGIAVRLAVPRLPAAAGAPGGSLSVVVPCRDEARGVEAALRSLLAQDHPDLEVVAVDDRSADGTGEILDRLASGDRRLRVLHLDELPAGWLGKSHACASGAAASTGRWILFTDGDVLFAPGALRAAVAFAEAHRLGHLVAMPRLLSGHLLERAFLACFAAACGYAFRPWGLRRPGTAGFAGVGAFNLVRRDAYLAIGGHLPLRLEVVDDVKLGLLLRRSGFPQGAVESGGLVSVRWQHGLAATVRGLVKNVFAAFEYRWLAAAGAAAGLLLLSAVPLLALGGPAPARLAGAAALALAAGVQGAAARRSCGGTGLEGLLAAPAAAALAGVFLASAAVTEIRGGVAWRGRFYPLAALRAGCVRAADWPARRAPGWE